MMDSDVVQLHNGTRLVTDITDLIIQFCRKRGTGCVMSLFRMQPRASR